MRKRDVAHAGAGGDVSALFGGLCGSRRWGCGRVCCAKGDVAREVARGVEARKGCGVGARVSVRMFRCVMVVSGGHAALGFGSPRIPLAGADASLRPLG